MAETIEALRARVHQITGLNTNSKSRPWLLRKLEEVERREQTHRTIAEMAARAGRSRNN